jgi:hypothetical protein
LFVGILGCTYALYFPKNSYFKGMIELILQITLIVNGLFLSRVGVVYIYSPLMARPTETKGQEGQILTLREANPGPQSGLRLMLAPKLGVDFIALAVTKYVLQPSVGAFLWVRLVGKGPPRALRLTFCLKNTQIEN